MGAASTVHYLSATLQPGDYILTATPYDRATGVQGTPLTIHFHVLFQEVSSFTLVDADSDEDIREPR